MAGSFTRGSFYHITLTKHRQFQILSSGAGRTCSLFAVVFVGWSSVTQQVVFMKHLDHCWQTREYWVAKVFLEALRRVCSIVYSWNFKTGKTISRESIE